MADDPQLLNTRDVQNYFRWVFDEAHGYKRITRWYRNVAYIGGEDSAFGRWAHRAVDYSGEGTICNKDFHLMHTGLDQWLEARRSMFDPRLPYVGQFAFGVGAGMTGAGMLKLALRHKWKCMLGGAVVYNIKALLSDTDSPEQALARQQINRVADAASDVAAAWKPLGTWERKDVAAFLDRVYLGGVNRKLGPGGYAEGVSGPVSLALGLWWGLRVL